jgi:hypothetical protein
LSFLEIRFLLCRKQRRHGSLPDDWISSAAAGHRGGNGGQALEYGASTGRLSWGGLRFRGSAQHLERLPFPFHESSGPGLKGAHPAGQRLGGLGEIEVSISPGIGA